MTDPEGMKIGDVAERTGLSIRTLRHYDELGLVAPSGYTPGGFRLYSEADVERLLLIRRMKPLGFTLEEMGTFLVAADALSGTGSPSPQVAEAAETVTHFRKETRERLAKLRRQVSYAEEFLTLLDRLDGA